MKQALLLGAILAIVALPAAADTTVRLGFIWIDQEPAAVELETLTRNAEARFTVSGLDAAFEVGPVIEAWADLKGLNTGFSGACRKLGQETSRVYWSVPESTRHLAHVWIVLADRGCGSTAGWAYVGSTPVAVIGFKLEDGNRRALNRVRILVHELGHVAGAYHRDAGLIQHRGDCLATVMYSTADPVGDCDGGYIYLREHFGGSDVLHRTPGNWGDIALDRGAFAIVKKWLDTGAGGER